MKLGNELIKHRFDEINEKVDLVMMYCRELQAENKELLSKIGRLESELDAEQTAKTATEENLAEQENIVDDSMQGLLSKLDSFSETITGGSPSDL